MMVQEGKTKQPAPLKNLTILEKIKTTKLKVVYSNFSGRKKAKKKTENLIKQPKLWQNLKFGPISQLKANYHRNKQKKNRFLNAYKQDVINSCLHN